MQKRRWGGKKNLNETEQQAGGAWGHVHVLKKVFHGCSFRSLFFEMLVFDSEARHKKQEDAIWSLSRPLLPASKHWLNASSSPQLLFTEQIKLWMRAFLYVWLDPVAHENIPNDPIETAFLKSLGSTDGTPMKQDYYCREVYLLMCISVSIWVNCRTKPETCGLSRRSISPWPEKAAASDWTPQSEHSS